MGYGNQFGVNTSLPGFASSGNFLGSAAGAGIGMALAPATGGASLLASPLIQMILGQVGGSLLSSLFGGGQSASEQNTGQDLAARRGLIGQLQQQASGQPTAATRTQSRQLSNQVNRLQQSYSASASRQGISGTTPGRAQQGRLQAAKLEGMGNIMGASQISAQQQLGQLVGGAPQQQLLAETQRREARRGFLGGISGIMTESKLQKQQGVLDGRLEQIIQSLLDAISGTKASLAG